MEQSMKTFFLIVARWYGKCWYVHNLLKYEFDLQFDVPVTYPTTPMELELPELEGKTAKMYKGKRYQLHVIL